MKIPKTMRKYCIHCRIHTLHKVTQLKSGRKRGLLKIGSRRHERRSNIHGYGGFPQPQISKGKKYSAKTTKKIDLRYECEKCKKKGIIGEGWRLKKVEFV